MQNKLSLEKVIEYAKRASFVFGNDEYDIYEVFHFLVDFDLLDKTKIDMDSFHKKYFDYESRV